MSSDPAEPRKPQPESLEITPRGVGQRVDRYLALRLGVPRNQIQQWIREEHLWVDGRTVKPSYALELGDRVTWEPPIRSVAHDLAPEEGELAILFEDDHLVVLDKPAGLAVHPGAGRPTGTLIHRLLARYPEMAETGGPNRPGIVHRLDKDTTGVMVVARTADAYLRLSEAFAERRVEKRYLAIVYGSFRRSTGEIDRPIGRHPNRRKEMAVRPDGRPAHTSYRVTGEANGISLLTIEIGTGRTHQIRVHLKAAGHPLVGDPVYGEARWKGYKGDLQRWLKGFGRPALHASSLSFDHPDSGDRHKFTAPPPSDLIDLWKAVADQDLARI